MCFLGARTKIRFARLQKSHGGSAIGGCDLQLDRAVDHVGLAFLAQPFDDGVHDQFELLGLQLRRQILTDGVTSNPGFERVRRKASGEPDLLLHPLVQYAQGTVVDLLDHRLADALAPSDRDRVGDRCGRLLDGEAPTSDGRCMCECVHVSTFF